jgi:hypothetical protein
MIKLDRPLLKAETVFNRSKCNGLFTSVALADILSSPNFLELVEATKRGVDNVGLPDPILTRVLEEVGFTALPVIVDSKHYELLIKNGLTPVYRGVKRDNAILDFATNPELFVGKGLLCNGVHFVYDDGRIDPLTEPPLKKAEKYAKKPPQGLHQKIDDDNSQFTHGQIIPALVSETARVIEIKELLKLTKMVQEGISKNQMVTDDTKQKMIKLLSHEASVIAALENIDMIVAERAQFLIVLNRGALIMDKGVVDSELKR